MRKNITKENKENINVKELSEKHNISQPIINLNISSCSDIDKTFFSQHPIEKKKSKFYQILKKSNIPNKEKTKNKKIDNEIYLPINDEIYKGEEFIIKPIDINIVINSNSYITKKRNMYWNYSLSLNKTSFTIINSNNNKFNIKNLEISKNINIKLSSLYENINKLSKYKYAADKQFQSDITQLVKRNYLEKKNNRRSSIIKNKMLNISKDKFASTQITEINEPLFKKKKRSVYKNNNSLIYIPFKYSLFESDAEVNKNNKIYKEDEKENKRILGPLKIHQSNTQVTNFKKPIGNNKKKFSLLTEISNNINALNHPGEFYNGLLNNILKNRDKDKDINNIKTHKFTHLPKYTLKRNSKTIKES